MSQNMKHHFNLRNFVEFTGAIGLILSLLSVAYEIRQSTLAARAAAIQEIGIATAEMWGENGRDPGMIRLLEGRTDIPIDDWTADDWARFLSQMVAWSRLAETGLLQVKEGLLPSSSLELLGYASTRNWLQHPGVNCLWKHRLRTMVSTEFATYVESGPAPSIIDCSEFSNFPFLGPSLIPRKTAAM